ncbi:MULTISPECIES: GNAT family N-acetyltransferase [Microbacterium]|uniref:GNAT family N-acetyltransferase n=1 Tax=Microbacterium TaxID=33882 RepID=UPI00217D41DF|nr:MULTISPECIES: GNAT family N-acetyltransferase [Microbacterium]UWF78451.1 GNAT family N-acetyltransferase [Microbacterium neungamense]WCM56627.1 GNAT family N-acetyltransferase [Microbacterium sp. EF45047]
MTTLAEELTIAPLTVPAALDAADAADFLAYAELNRRVCAHDAGLPELAPSAQEMLPDWLDATDRLQLGFVARRQGRLVGVASMTLAQEDGSTTGESDVLIEPDAWSTAWGPRAAAALLAALEDEARRRGRTSLQTWTLHRPGSADRTLIPATGWGRVAATELSETLESAGYRLEQVERNSEFDLQGDTAGLEKRLASALASAGPDYRVVAWTLPTPPEHQDGYAQVLSRLATDVPSGDLAIDEERWDAARVRRRDRRFADSGQTVSVAAVQHVPTSALVAYNELVIGPDLTGVTHQFGTLVRKEHRGHRLGTIVKCANLLRWRSIAPASPKVSTFNAEENRPMLDINEALGFVPVSYTGAWQKRLS